MKGAVSVPDSVHMTRSLRCPEGEDEKFTPFKPHTTVTVPIIDFKDETVEFKSSSFIVWDVGD